MFGLPTRHEVGLEMALHPGQQPSLETLPQPEAVLSDSRTQLAHNWRRGMENLSRDSERWQLVRWWVKRSYGVVVDRGNNVEAAISPSRGLLSVMPPSPFPLFSRSP